MSAQFDLFPGFDASSLASITQAQLLQMVAQITPLPNIGGIIVGSGAANAHPDVTNNNRFIRYLWIDTQTANNPVIKIYTGNPYSDTYADWSSFAVPNNSVTTLMLQALSVTIAKMSSTGGANGQLLQVNAAGGYSFINFSALLTASIIPLTALDKTAAADGMILQYKASDGLILWRSIDSSAFAAGAISPTKLANLGAYQFLVGDVNGAIAGLKALSVANAPNYIDPLAIPLTKLEGTGTPAIGDYVSWNGSNWVKQTRKLTTADFVMVQDSVLQASIAHNLGSTPALSIYLVSKADTATTGYTIGDIIPMSSVIAFTTVGPVLTAWASVTNYGFNASLDSATYQIQKKNATAQVNVTRAQLIADWNARLILTV